MSLVQNHHLVIEKIGVVDALPHKHTVGYIPYLSVTLCFIIEPDSIPYLVAQSCSSLLADAVGHAHCSHTPRLRTDYFDFRNGSYGSLRILFYLALFLLHAAE